ncbi:hypothetical protein FB45DRAFT_1025823 [Roridomyces roridus]|uniref:G-protein coupled receptors family 2 profile 2 domain-containing protein n=1 Tax=Roridomyces roridus TaxID=1738132 RepID=A0AAD7BZM3_9AGAR|nr:hypothetical protein FB45DRAFT_1025823 [Roridomyces roridus]
MTSPGSFNAHVNDLVLGFGVAGIVSISLTLGAFAYLAWNPVSRPHLNRVSFRLLVYALILSYAAIMIGATRDPAGWQCNLSAFLGGICMIFGGAMFFCMALNLQLVLVHAMNGRKMERYYVLAGFFMAAACNIPAYTAGAFGFWEGNTTCWFNSPNPSTQLQWFIGSQGFWLIFMAFCEVISFGTIVWYMMFCQRTTSGISETIGTMSSVQPLPKPPIVLYRKIILRIGLYPIFSCFFNITGCILDIYVIRNPNTTSWRLGAVDLLVYILRPLMYVLLAVTDPSFLRGLRALRPQATSRNPRSRAHSFINIDIRTWPSSAATVDSSKEGEEGIHNTSSPEFTRQI